LRTNRFHADIVCRHADVADVDAHRCGEGSPHARVPATRLKIGHHHDRSGSSAKELARGRETGGVTGRSESGLDGVDGMCGGGEDPMHRVIAAGEGLLAQVPPLDPRTAAEVHRLVGDAYADIVALAAGAGMEYTDTVTYVAEAPAARRNGIAHYRQSFVGDRDSPEARDAWLEAWRLIAGLPPSTTHFFCVYD